MALFDTTDSTTTGIKDGEHAATIVDAEVKDTKAGDGKYINVKWRLDNGVHVFKMYIFEHPSQQTVNIGMGQIGKMQVACGQEKGPVESTDSLLGLRCMVTIKNKSDSYGDKADIVNYKKAGDIPF